MSVALPYFYPRPPRGGRRAVHLFLKLFCIFLSTPSARRATYQPGERRNARGFLSTPSARRATHPRFCCSGESGISIHALREEGDVCGSPHAGHHKGFLSTPSARRATKVGGHGLQVRRISIHALREEGDLSRMAQNLQQVKFLSTPSARRATSQASNKSHRPKPFLSTPSARRATFFRCTSCWIDTISIHALREEGDILRGIGQWRNSDFYPRPPRGGRPKTTQGRGHRHKFLSTPSARRATINGQLLLLDLVISIHALREEGDYQRAVAFA